MLMVCIGVFLEVRKMDEKETKREKKEPKTRIGKAWEHCMENPKQRKICFAVLGILLGLAVTALCVWSYARGLDDGKKDLNKSFTITSNEGKNKKSAKQEVTEEAAEITQEAVSEASAEAVVDTSEEQEKNTSKNHNQSKNTNSGSNKSGTTASSSGGGAAYGGKLAVKGNQLCTADGTPIQLRGVSTHGLSWFPQYVNAQLFGEIRGWGANVIRLAMYTAEYNGYCTGGNQSQLKELVKNGVQYATEQNLYVIIDWHILSDGNPNTYKAQAVEFFKEMSSLYKDNDHVLYEICNEPNGGTGWSEIKSYAKEIIGVIRANDPDGVILVGTPTWSQEVDKAAADPITEYENIMYTLHFYADTHRDSLRNTLKAAVEGGLPVFVSEFGICDASGNGNINIQQADAWIQLLNQYGVSFVSWNLSNKAESSSLIASGCSKTSGITQDELSESGKWLLKTLAGSASAGGSGGNASGQGEQPPSNPVSQPAPQPADNGQTSGGGQPQKSPEQYQPSFGGGAQAVVVNSWQEGNAFCIQYEIKVANTTGGNQEGWQGTMTFPANVQVVSGWNANFSASGTTVTFSNMDYNKTIPAGGKAEGIGCIVRFE